MHAPWRHDPPLRAHVVVPLTVWATLVAGGGSVLVSALFLAGVPVVPFAILAAMAQFALYTIVAFGDGQHDLFPLARWWERALFAVGATTQGLRGLVFAVDRGLYGSPVMTLVGALGCVAVAVAFVTTARRHGWTWYSRWLATGVTLGLVAFVSYLAGADATTVVALLALTSVCEVVGALTALRRPV